MNQDKGMKTDGGVVDNAVGDTEHNIESDMKNININTSEGKEHDDSSEGFFKFVVSDLEKEDLKSARFSPIFKVNKLDWKLLIRIIDGKLGVFLTWHIDKNIVSQKVYGECTFRLISAAGNEQCLVRKIDREFTVEEVDYGYMSFISMTDLKDPNKMFLNNNEFVIECYVACGSVEDILPSHVEAPVVKQQETDASVLEGARRLLDSGVACDCEFILSDGKDTSRKQASTFSLARASPVFESMFYGPLKHNKIVEITDINTDAFSILLYYVHGADWKFESQAQAVSVYYAAKKYLMADLEACCISYIWPQGVDTVWLAFDCAVTFGLHNMEKAALVIIEKNKETIFKNEHFFEISQQSLQSLLQRNQLGIPEIVLFEAVLSWAKYHEDRGIESSGTNLRAVIGEAIRHIRFLSMSAVQFAGSPCKSGMLSSDEMAVIFRRILTDSSDTSLPYLSCLRQKRRKMS